MFQWVLILVKTMATKSDRKLVTLRLPVDLIERTKKFADERDTTFTQVVEMGLFLLGIGDSTYAKPAIHKKRQNSSNR